MSKQGHPRTGERITAPLRPVKAAPGAPTVAPPPHSGPVAQQVQHLRAASKAVVDACPAVSAWLGAQCRVAAQLMMRDTRQNYLWTTAERPRNKKYHVECASLVAPSATGLCEHCGITFVPGKNCRCVSDGARAEGGRRLGVH